ncbi:hypothetical protein Hypma_005064 [Hypsizygus marmoreus]|uniref:F-box domain-containing protein n=1 Tax=Hypsizygus marmoreus TaxID=39966 RepID=A0A369K5B2_HYPMA|nr:hypothetical protein Hypma_005064 [Hypsizygus marmoreus]
MCVQSDVLSNDLWSRLPTELIREIILYLASTNRKTARQLRLVSRYANVWVLPMLFRIVTFTSPDHVTRFASTLLPKRKLHIPAMKSMLHTSPRPLSSYNIESVALVVNTRLPSVEIALASVAPAFSRVKKLVITAQNLSSNAHWLRQHPIRPNQMMILHFGSPHTVNFHEPIFQEVTHLYTSVLSGYRETSVKDMPQLTHLAAHTRLNLPIELVACVAEEITQILTASTLLKQFVLVLDSDGVFDNNNWIHLLEPCFRDQRFMVLPFFRNPRWEWRDMLRGRETIWDRANAWRSVERGDEATMILRRTEILASLRSEQLSLPRNAATWEIDLVERESYTPYEGDPTERLYKRTPYPKHAVE